MSIHVICSGCLKRFQVADRFAGMRGSCPGCGTIIPIPKEPVKIHDDDATGPIQRLKLEFDHDRVKYCTLGVFGVLLLTFLLGCMPMWDFLRSFFGLLGLCLVAFPLVLFGYHVLRNQNQIFAFAGEDLYRRAGIVAGGYAVLWIAFECFLAATLASAFVGCLYLGAFAVLATLLAFPLLGLKLRDAFLHFCTFALSVIVLRFLIGFGWFWQSSELIRRTAAPPPPFLPGM